jgi:hypothetical protein
MLVQLHLDPSHHLTSGLCLGMKLQFFLDAPLFRNISRTDQQSFFPLQVDRNRVHQAPDLFPEFRFQFQQFILYLSLIL